MKRKSTVFTLILVALMAASAVPSHSQSAMEDAEGLEMILFQEIPSVYSASKYEQKVTEAPAFVSIVTADEIRKYGYRTLDQALRSLPGFYLTYDRSYSYLGTRGFSRPGDYNTRLLLLLDGVRLNDSVYDAASVGTEFILDIDLIDRIEVVRGPASSLYGSNAIFGVINVISKRGRDLQGLEISGEAGSLDTYKTRLTYGQRFSRGPELILSGTYYESRGDDSLYFPEYDDRSTNNGIFEDNDDDQYFSLFGRASWGDFDLEGAYVTREKGLPTGAYDTVFNDPASETTDSEYFLSLSYRHTYAGNWDVLGRAYYASYPYQGDYAYDYAEEEDEEAYLVTNKDESDARWWGVEAQATRTFFDSHTLSAGAEFRDNIRQNQKNYDEEVYLESEQSSLFFGVFIQDEWRITDGLFLNIGLRYDDFENYDGTWSPRAALIHSPRETTTLKLLYGEAYRIPNAYEQYYNDGGETQKQAPPLNTESIRTFEGIWEQQLGRNLRSTVAGFYYRLDNLINLSTDPEDDLLVFGNIEEVEARGVEVQLEGKWASGIEGRVSYTWQDAENRETGEDLFNSPDHLAKLNLIVPIIGDRLFTGAELLYTSDRITKSGGTGDSFLANLTLFDFTVPNRLEISASVYNLFDEEIAHPATEELLQEVIVQNGRTARLKVTVSF